MLETSFPSFISKTPGEIPIFWTFFGEKFNFGLYFTENRQIGQIGNYDVIVTSYMGHLYFFDIYGKHTSDVYFSSS